MALKSLGKVTVTTAGTPVRATLNESTPTARYAVQSLSVQALAGNSGTNIYVGNSAMNKSTLAGVFAIVPKGSTASAVIIQAPAGILANEIYLDADTNGDAALVSATEQ